MNIKKYIPFHPDFYLYKKKGDTEIARFGHINNLVDQINDALNSIPPPPATPTLQSVLNAGNTATNKSIELSRTTSVSTISNITNYNFRKVYDSYGSGIIGKNPNINNHFAQFSYGIDYYNPNAYNLWAVGFGLTTQAEITPGNFNYKSFTVRTEQPGKPLEVRINDGFLTNSPMCFIYPNKIKFEYGSGPVVGSVEINAQTLSGTNVLNLPNKTGTLAIEDTTAYTGSIVVGSQTLNFVNGILKTVI